MDNCLRKSSNALDFIKEYSKTDGILRDGLENI